MSKGSRECRFKSHVLWLLVLGFVVMGFAAKPGFAGHCPAPSPPAVVLQGTICIIPVTTYIGQLDSNGLPADAADDQLGAYHNNVDGVSSWLTSNGYNHIAYGDWQFTTYGSTARAVSESLDQDDAIGAATPPYWGTQVLQGHLEVKCTAIKNDMLTMAAGTVFTCPLINKFNYLGADWTLSPAKSVTGYPETTDVQVRCNTVDSLGCNDWFIDPINLGEAVGRLMSGSNNDGDFYMRFHIHITRP